MSKVRVDNLSHKMSDLEASNRRLAAFTELNFSLAWERDSQRLLDQVCRSARDLVGARYAVLCINGQSADQAVFLTSGINETARKTLERPRIDQGMLGLAISERRAHRITNPTGDATAVGLPRGYPAMHGALVAPVVSLSRCYGWILLADKLGAPEFSDADEQVLTILAAQVGRIYENDSLFTEVKVHAERLQLELARKNSAAESLLQSEAGLNRALQMARITHVVTGPDGQFESWPDSLPEMVGLDPARMITSTREWLHFVHADERALFRAKAIEAGASGVRMDFEYRLRRGDGVMLHIRQVMEPLQEASGPHVRMRWFNTIQDISEQKHAAEVLRESQRRFSDVLGNVEMLSVMLDRDGRVTYCNEHLLQLTGWQRDELIGRNWYETVVAPGNEDLKGRLFSVVLDKLPDNWHRENEIHTRNGERRLIRWHNTLLRSVTGEVVGAAGLGDDITDRAAAEQKIRRLNRVYAVLSGINTLIVRVRQREELFRESCRIAVEQGQLPMALIGTVDHAAGTISLAAVNGIDMAFVRQLTARISIQEGVPAGAAVVAVNERRPVVVNNILTDPIPVPARAMLVEQGIQSLVALPLLVDGVVDGVIMFCANEINFFDQAEMRLLSELAGDIGFALEHIATSEKLDYLAFYDQLTGLPNRTLLVDRCTHDIKTAQRDGKPIGMMVLGIDDFKTVNDALGPSASDAVLKQFAGRVAAALREQDTVARLGGDEFVLVLPGASPEGIGQLAVKLQHIVAEPFLMDGDGVNITASIGVAMFPGDGSDFDTLLKCAQAAMHQAGEHGRGNHRFFNAQLFERTVAQMALATALRSAIAREQLDLHYQPFVDLQTGQIAGMEALLRWTHPELGAVSPSQFIPVAEQSGQIVEIGAWVLRRACGDIRGWLDRGIRTPPVSVNVSPLQFRDGQLLQQLESAMRDFRVAPGMLCVEVTEGALMLDIGASRELLLSLKSLGVRLSLDDFGTGYSSLSYLKLFPFDKVKIDQSFVRGLNENMQDAVIAKVVISMAHGLGLRVIAEGVETEAQCEFLRNSMSDEIQGYFFSRPIPKDGMEALLQADRRLPAHLLRLRVRERTLLLVDDEPNVIAALRRLLRHDGYRILSANGGAEGLEQLSRNPVDIIVSDQRMPGMTGIEFLKRAKSLYPDTVRIVLSGYTELQSVTDAVNEGAVYRFLTKPWDDSQLRGFVKEAFEYKELADENRQLSLQIRTANQELATSNRQLQEVLDQQQRQIEMRERSLDQVREALHGIPIPVFGLDSEGLIVFVNTQAQTLFSDAGALLEREIAEVAPDLDALIARLPAGQGGSTQIDGREYRVQWQKMGEDARSAGKIVTFSPVGG